MITEGSMIYNSGLFLYSPCNSYPILLVVLFEYHFQIGDLGLAVSSTVSRAAAGASGTLTHMPPEAFSNPDIEPDEAWDIFT